MTRDYMMTQRILKSIKDDEGAFLEGVFLHEKEGYYFHESLIEALRLRVIEEITDRLTESADCSKIIDDCVEIINKHLGVTE